MAYDPFTHRKKIPPFPSVFGGTVGFQGPKNSVPGGDYKTPFGPVSKKEGTGGLMAQYESLPEFPQTGAQGPAGDALPDVPIPGMGGLSPLVPALSPPGTDSHLDDTTHASNLISELDDIWKSISGTAETQWDKHEKSYTQPGPSMDYLDPSKMSPIGARPRDRSWMFQPIGSSPAPVTFNKTDSDQWGTTMLDKRPQSSGPAASSVRYYERAMERAQGGNKTDANRIRRLDQRINARPTDG